MDGRRCVKCGKGMNPTEGHNIYLEWRKPFQGRNATQISLCEECVGGLEVYLGIRFHDARRSCTAPVCPYMQGEESMTCDRCSYANGRIQNRSD